MYRQEDAVVKLDPIPTVTLNGGVPQEYETDCYRLDIYRRATFMVEARGLGPNDFVEVTCFDASDEIGTAPLTVDDPQMVPGPVIDIEGNVDAQVASITLGAGPNVPVVGDVVTINGIDFTNAAATDVTAREWLNLAGLILCINDADYGVPLVDAIDETTFLTLRSSGRGEETITLSSTSDAREACRTVSALAYIEVDQGSVNTFVNYSHPSPIPPPARSPYYYVGLWIEATLDTAPHVDVGGAVVRSGGRKMPRQYVAARGTRGV